MAASTGMPIVSIKLSVRLESGSRKRNEGTTVLREVRKTSILENAWCVRQPTMMVCKLCEEKKSSGQVFDYEVVR